MFESKVNTILNEVEKKYWSAMEQFRVARAQKLYHWYMNHRDEIHDDVRAALLKTFRPTTVEEMNIRVRNVVPRIINKIAQVYKHPAKRVLDGGAALVHDGGETKTIRSREDELFQQILLNSAINKKSKLWHRLGILFNTVLVQPVVLKESGKEPHLDFFIHTPAFTVVETDQNQWNIPVAFYYPIEKTIEGKSQQVLVYWSATEHYLIDKLGTKHAPPENPGMLNPYHRLPVATLRFQDDEDFWGEGKWSLVEGNEEVAVQYSNIAFTALFQTHGQAVAINTGLKGEPEVGPNRVIKIENAGQAGQQQSDFKFVSPNPAILEVQGLIDWLVKSLHVDEGLSPQQFATEVATTSGIAKILDSADLNEQREDHRQILEDFEHDLFNVIRTVWNTEVPNKKISESATFSIQFGEPKVVKTIDEKIKERESAIALNTGSRVDFIMEDNPEFTREQAQEKLRQIMSENQIFKLR
ncbi:MAG: phage portal protein [Bacteroidetes bacterium]|nr:MAG: phage portal protein [Bacteroidota bacterium]